MIKITHTTSGKLALNLAGCLMLLCSSSSFADRMSFIPTGHTLAEIGGYWSSQGKQQTINIIDFVGDEFTVTSPNGKNGALGIYP